MSTTSPQTLIVPIDIAALCVGQTDVNGSDAAPYGTKDFARIEADFSKLPYLDANRQLVNQGPNTSDAVLPQPFERTPEPLQQGVHLHWALPSALAHGASHGQNDVEFPTAPNRWLVLRIASSHATPTAPVHVQRAWIVESDRLWDKHATEDPIKQNAYSRDVPTQPVPDQVPNKAFSTIGRVYAYETWLEQPGSSVTKHTALGYGNPAYVAAYPHCQNVFGFYDTLADLDLAAFDPSNSRLSYLVVGWYSDSHEDPLARIPNPHDGNHAEQLATIQRTYNWTFTVDTSRGLPSQTLCTGVLMDIAWNPNVRYVHPRPPGQIDVAIGNNTAEALSALLASQPSLANEPNVERLLNALQMGLLPRLGQPDGLAQLEEALHQKGFTSVRAGKLWIIKRATPGCNTDRTAPRTVTSTDVLDAARGIGQALPTPVAGALNELNVLQQQCDSAQFEIDSLRSQIFADWHKYMVLEYPQGPSTIDNPTVDAAFYFIKDEIEVLNGKIAGLKTATARLEETRLALIRALGTEYTLANIQSPRFWQVNDPVVLLSGSDVQPSYRYASNVGQDAAGNLICRLASQVVNSMTVQSDKFGIHASALPGLPVSPNRVYAAEFLALLDEAFFLDPNQAWILAQAVAAQGGPTNPAIADLNGFVATIQEAQRSLLASPALADADISFIGMPPTVAGFKTWSQPWIPLIMQWEINSYAQNPVATKYEPDFITRNYQLDDDQIDLVNRQSVPQKLENFETYNGAVVLSHNTEINLKAQIDEFVQNNPNDPNIPELKAIRDNLSLPMLAQALDGFNAALIMRKQTLQLPVSDPLAIANGLDHYRFSNIDVKNAVAGQNNAAPLPRNSYNPLRAGLTKIARIRIIDAFGQVKDLVDPPVVRAENLIPAGDRATNPLIGLPPRITQPSRLLFRWLSANDDQVQTNTDPVSTPVCGWVLFNHLDDNLMIYDADGDGLGSLNLRGPLWQGAPGRDSTFGQPIEAVFADANPHLRNFALGIYHNSGAKDFLTDMLAAIDCRATTISPPNARQDQGIGVLIGRPLALVRASLKLELLGSPAIDQSWAAFADAVNANQFEDRFDANFPHVLFPVRLGDVGQVGDGLIGYFIDDGSTNAYRNFYTATSQHTSNGVVPPVFGQLALACANDAPMIVLSMLVDPRAVVHATAGILPVKNIGIPPHMYTNALAHLAVSFLTTPVISSASKLTLPIGSKSGHNWSWVACDPTKDQWSVQPIGQANSAATLSYMPQQISEGWLNLSKIPISFDEEQK